jgi:environmental stress-induced protein Ves
MAALELIPRTAQRDEPWANGAGTTKVILREPDSAAWQIRVSVARVETEGPFSELPATRRTLVPLDAPMTLRFPAGNVLHARRFGTLRFDGAPAPTGLLPEGPTRDFNLMLRGDTHGEALPRTLLDSMLLPLEPGTRWLAYLDSGHATLRAGDVAPVHLNHGDAALVTPKADTGRVILEGAGEIVLVKLYA